MSALEACNPDEIFSEEVEKIISATLSTLSEQTRRAFILSRFENKSNKEIAEEMEISIKGVEYHISKSIESTAGDFKRLSSFILFSSFIIKPDRIGIRMFLRTKMIFFIFFFIFF